MQKESIRKQLRLEIFIISIYTLNSSAIAMTVMPISDKGNNKTIVIERDENIDHLIWKQDLLMIRNLVNYRGRQKNN
jgi:hypothetical protein